MVFLAPHFGHMIMFKDYPSHTRFYIARDLLNPNAVHKMYLRMPEKSRDYCAVVVYHFELKLCSEPFSLQALLILD